MVERSASVPRDERLDRVEAACAVLLGLMTALVGLLYLLLPSDQRLQEQAAVLLPSFAEDGTVLRLELLALALTGILGLAAVPALSRLARPGFEGWVRWTGSLALLGFAETAVSNFRSLNRLPGIAEAFVAGDASTRAALAPLWRSSLDPDGILGKGAVGLWVLVICVLALRRGVPPKAMWSLGLLLGVAYALVPVAQLSDVPSLLLVSAAVGTVVALVWYIWAGTVALRGRG